MNMQGTNVVVAGVGMTRFGKYSDRGMRSLAEEAVADALKDAGITAKDVEAVFFSNAAAGLLTGQEMIRAARSPCATPSAGCPVVQRRECLRVGIVCVSSRMDGGRVGNVRHRARGRRRKDTHRGQRPALSAPPPQLSTSRNCADSRQETAAGLRPGRTGRTNERVTRKPVLASREI